MNKKYRNVSFLVELLINVLVFSISCAILVALFGRAARLAADTKQESFAGVEASALLERVKVRGAGGVTHGQWQADGSVICGYDAAWMPVNDAAQAVYTIHLTITPQSTGAGTLNGLLAVAMDGEGKEIYRLETASYVPTEW